MPSDDTSLAILLAAYQLAKPNEIATLRSILRAVVLPHLGCKTSLETALARTPAAALYGTLNAERTAWCPALARKLPAGQTYQKAYCRSIKRLIAHGEAKDLLHPDHHSIAPAWRALVSHLQACIVDHPVSQRRALLAAFKRLARWATSCKLQPQALPLQLPGQRPMAAFVATFDPLRDSDFYRARKAWNLLIEATPDLGLNPWPAGMPGKLTACPSATWPPILQQAMAAVVCREGLGSWRPETQKGYAYRLGSYLAVLAKLNISVEVLLAGLSDPEDAVRLLFQGLPTAFSKSSAQELAQHLVADEAVRTHLLQSLREVAGSYDGRASERNPFLADALSYYMECGTITTALNLVSKAMAINRGYLEVADRHLEWLRKRKALLVQRAKKQPSAYAAKKRALFRQPELWERLVRARGRLRAHTAALEEAWREARGERKRFAQRRWAIALRNEVLLGLMLCYPLRVNNLVGMRVGVHYHPANHHVFFHADETKNEKEIDYELPEGGALGDLRALIDTYLQHARPALLDGRHSDYFFIPDPRGGTQLRIKAVNAILLELSRRFLTDILPPGVDALNPHLLRHATASYQLVVCQNLNLAAQLLNDSPATITQAYADVLACKKEATKRFLSTFTLEATGSANR